MKTEIRFKKTKLAFLAAAVLCLAFALCACGEAENTDIGAGSDASVADVTEEMLNSEEEAGAAQAPSESQTPEGSQTHEESQPESRGTKQPIPEDIRAEMAGVSMPEGAQITYDELSYLTIPHYDYDGNIAEGHIIVDATLADEVLDIFQELFLMQFPIERMEIIDRFEPYIDETFNNLDRASMSMNNTSAFCYRLINGTDTMSYHARGRAIDINPKINPYYIPASGYVSPANAYEYADRTQDWPGIIRRGDAVYNAFISRGWEWGGDWEGELDYQHFQKP